MPVERLGAHLEYSASLLESGFQRTEPFPTEAIQVESHAGNVRKTSALRLRVQAETHMMLVVRTATLLVWSDATRQWAVLPPNSLAYVAGPANYVMHLGKGDHRLDIFSFGNLSAPFLAAWLDRAAAHRQRRSTFVSMAVSPIFRSSLVRIDRALARADRISEPSLMGVLHEVLPRLALSESDLDLAPLPGDLPANIKHLTEQVKGSPDRQWPLKDAADLVGYSPFHFSRVFKQLVGYGFHEFADRCRTENAVREICKTDAPIDVVAATTGFGTTQALRESIKEYLGLVPSELRAEPSAT